MSPNHNSYNIHSLLWHHYFTFGTHWTDNKGIHSPCSFWNKQDLKLCSLIALNDFKLILRKIEKSVIKNVIKFFSILLISISTTIEHASEYSTQFFVVFLVNCTLYWLFVTTFLYSHLKKTSLNKSMCFNDIACINKGEIK